MLKKSLLLVLVGLFAVGGLAGCSEKKKTTGEKFGELMDKGEEKVKEGAKELKEKADDAAEEVEKKLDE